MERQNHPLRKSGIELLGDIPWGSHLCEFYDSRDDLLDILVPYFKAGLENNEYCMWVVSDPLTAEDALSALEKAVPSLAAYLKKRQIEIIPHTDWYLKGGSFDLERVLNAWLGRLSDALSRGYDGMRVTGNTAWIEKKDWASFAEYERVLNERLGDYRILAICTYSSKSCSLTDVIDVVRNHELAIVRHGGRLEAFENFELKKAREEAATALDLNKKIFSIAPVGFTTYDASGRCIGANEEAARIIGATLEEVLKQNFRELRSWKESGLLDAAEAALKEDAAKTLQVHVVSSFGKEPWLDCRFVPFSSGGEQRLLLTFSDISVQKKAQAEREAALAEAEGAKMAREIIDNMADPVVITDMEGRITYLNKGIRGFGYDVEIIGSPCTSLARPDDALLIEDALRACAEKGPVNVECTLRASGGREVPVLLGVSAIKSPSGGHKGFVVSARDVSGIKRSEAEKARLVHDLGERIKELKTLRNISDILQNTDTLTPEALTEIVAILPLGWQYPETTVARIKRGSEVFETKGFMTTPWMQSSSFKSAEGVLWVIDVAYTEERPPEVEGPFLSEERNLIDSIAEMLKSFNDRKETLSALEWELGANAGIAELSRSLISSASIDDISGMVLAVALKFTQSPIGYVGYIDPATGSLISPTLTKDVWDKCRIPQKSFVFSNPGGMVGWVLDNKGPILTNDIQKDPRSEGTPEGHIPIRKLLSVPAVVDGVLIGQIAVANSGRDYNERDLLLAERLATLYAIAVKKQRADERLRQADIVVRSSTAVLLRYRAEEGFPVDFISESISKYGYSREDILSGAVRFRELISLDDAKEYEKRLEDALKRGLNEFTAEYRLFSSDGRLHWMEERSTAEKDQDGKVVCFQGVAVDITDRKEAEIRMAYEMELTNHLLMIADATIKTSDIDILMEQIASCTQKIFASDLSLTYLWDEEGRVFRGAGESGLPPESAPLFRMTALNMETPAVREAFDRKAAAVLKSEEGESVHGFEWAGKVKGFILLPLMGKDSPLGIIAALHTRQSEMHPGVREKRLWDGVAYQVSVAIERAVLNKVAMFKTVELSRKIETIQTMNMIDRRILSTFDSKEILETAARMVSKVIHCEAGTLFLLDGSRRAVIYSAGFGLDTVKKGESVALADTSSSEVLKSGMPLYLGNLLDIKKPLPFEIRLIREGLVSYIGVPLVVKGQIIGIFALGSGRAWAFSPEDIQTLEKLSYQIAVAYENARLLTDLEELFIGIVKALSHSIDAKSHWTMGHSERVTAIALKLGRTLGLTEKELKELEIAGLLHDLGKIGTYELLLDKPGRLTPEEEEVIRRHPIKGIEILRPIKQLEEIMPAIRHHHEFFNGAGYPDGIRGEDIPLMARILSVADSVDAMLADRPYRKGKTIDEVIVELKNCSGTQFDPEIVDAFLKISSTIAA